MHSKLYPLLLGLLIVVIGCANDTGTGPASYDDYTPNNQDTPKATFPNDVTYIGIATRDGEAHLVMKNNTNEYILIEVNYTVTCTVNGITGNAITKTAEFWFHPYEQKENISSIDGNYHKTTDTISCSGTILSIIPSIGYDDEFQAWTGSYPISTK